MNSFPPPEKSERPLPENPRAEIQEKWSAPRVEVRKLPNQTAAQVLHPGEDGVLTLGS